MDESTTAAQRMRTFLKSETAPDVLDTIANLSNDEVFTAPGLANKMLDLLPIEVWSNPDLKFLDPCCKTGVFLREITKRLMVGLAKKIPNVHARREHILRHQIYGIAITQLTALMSRRTLYCASDATRLPNPKFPENCFSAVVFDKPEGNIAFPMNDDAPFSQHSFAKGKCSRCGASEGTLTSANREGRESYAYPFIHMDIQEIFGNMQFDVIIGNPPYQISDGSGGNGSSAVPVYQTFIQTAKKLNPRFMSMIIPARWYAGGKGLDDFRQEMLQDNHISEIRDVPIASDCFPGVEIKGGVCYFLRTRESHEKCRITTMRNGQASSTAVRRLNEFDVLIRHNEAVSILEKVKNKTEKFMDEVVSSSKPFGFRSNFQDFSQNSSPNSVKIYARGIVGWVDRNLIKVNQELIEPSKVIISKAYGAGESFPHQIIGSPIIADSGSVCTETYLVLHCGSQDECINIEKYIRSRFFRFMLHLRKPTQNISKSCFSFVPVMSTSEVWNDKKLYAYFGIDSKEIAFIDSMIREMP